MKAAIVIPARYQSSRFPGKPLVQILGKSLIQRVWERCRGVVPDEHIFVATDDRRISSHCAEFGARTLMTSPNCLTGTDRVAEAAEQIACPTIINVQGDEPLISPEDVAVVLAAALARPDLVHNAVCPIVTDDDFRNRNVPKVVIRSDCQLLYMSRAAIPGTKDDKFTAALRQVCIYGFSRDHLRLFAKQSTKSPLEALEDIEILRFLEMGVPVQMTHLRESTHAVDVPEDVAKIERILRERQ